MSGLPIAQWSAQKDGSSVIDDARYYCRAWQSHRAAMARLTFGATQTTIEVSVPFNGGNYKRRNQAVAEAKAMLLGVVVMLRLNK